MCIPVQRRSGVTHSNDYAEEASRPPVLLPRKSLFVHRAKRGGTVPLARIHVHVEVASATFLFRQKIADISPATFFLRLLFSPPSLSSAVLALCVEVTFTARSFLLPSKTTIPADATRRIVCHVHTHTYIPLSPCVQVLLRSLCPRCSCARPFSFSSLSFRWIRRSTKQSAATVYTYVYVRASTNWRTIHEGHEEKGMRIRT